MSWRDLLLSGGPGVPGGFEVPGVPGGAVLPDGAIGYAGDLPELPPGGTASQNTYVAFDGYVYPCGPNAYDPNAAGRESRAGESTGRRSDGTPVERGGDDGRRGPVGVRRPSGPARTLRGAPATCPPNGSPPPAPEVDFDLGSDGSSAPPPDSYRPVSAPSQPVGLWLAVGGAALLFALALR